jgi:hypothetical protein
MAIAFYEHPNGMLEQPGGRRRRIETWITQG